MNGNPYDLARRIRSWGSENPWFDALMLLGPVVVLAVLVSGRNAVTTAIAAGYVVSFVVVLALNAVASDEET